MTLFSRTFSRSPRNPGAVGQSGPWEVRRFGRRVFQTQSVVLVVAVVFAVVSAWFALTFPPRVAAASFAVMLAGFVILLEPAVGLMAYFNIAFMRPHETFWGFEGTRLSFLVSMFTLGATLLNLARRPNLRWVRKSQVFFTLVLWAFIHLSVEFSVRTPNQMKWLDYYDKMFLIYFVTLTLLSSEKWLFRLAWVLAVSIGYLGIWANQMYFVEKWAVVHGPGRPGATFYDENGFAMMLVMSIPFCWYLILHHRNFIIRAGLAAVMILTAHGVFTTYSRGGFLGLVSIATVFVMRQKNRWLGIALTVAAASFFVAVTGPRYLERIASIETYEEDDSAKGRLESWDAGMKMAFHNPLFGVGLTRYRQAFPEYSEAWPRVAHNSWVQLGAECGFVAVGAYGALMILTFLSLRRVRRRLPHLPEESRRLCTTVVGACEASLVGYLVCGFFLSMEDSEFYYLLVAMGQILDRLTEERLQEGRATGPAEVSAEPAPPVTISA